MSREEEIQKEIKDIKAAQAIDNGRNSAAANIRLAALVRELVDIRSDKK